MFNHEDGNFVEEGSPMVEASVDAPSSINESASINVSNLNLSNRSSSDPSADSKNAVWINKRYSKCPIIIESFILRRGKTSNHHPHATCRYCDKQIVCGAKERLISHLKFCKKTSDNVRELVINNYSSTPLTFPRPTASGSSSRASRAKKSADGGSPKVTAKKQTKQQQHQQNNGQNNGNGNLITQKRGQIPKTGSQNSKGRQTQKSNIDRAYLRMIISRSLPFDLSDTVEFRRFMSLSTGDDYEPPTSTVLLTKIMKRDVSQIKRQMIETVGYLPRRSINFEFDTWLDIEPFDVDIDDDRDSLSDFEFKSCINNFSRQRVKRRFYVIVLNVEYNGRMRRYLHTLRCDDFHHSDSVPMAIDSRAYGLDVVKIHSLLSECIEKIGGIFKVNSLTFDSSIGSLTSSSSNNSNVNLNEIFNDWHTSNQQVLVHHCLAIFARQLFVDLVENSPRILESIQDSFRLLTFVSTRPSLAKKLEQLFTWPLPSPYASLIGTNSIASNSPNNIGNGDVRQYEKFHPHPKSWSIICNSLTALKLYSSNVCEIVGNYHQTAAPPQHSRQHEAIKEHILFSADYWQHLEDSQQILYLLVQLVSSIENNCCRLSDFFAQYLAYGRHLLCLQGQGHQQLIMSFMKRFCQLDVSLLMAAYLLDPRYSGAYIREEGIKLAIERILTIASEQGDFDEDDGKVLYEYWELFLKRQEPFNLANKSDPIDWWMSIRSCPQSIQAIATRILRLRPTPADAKKLLSPLLKQKDVVRMDTTMLEEIAMLRFAYEYDDRGYHCNNNSRSNQQFMLKPFSISSSQSDANASALTGDELLAFVDKTNLYLESSCNIGLNLLNLDSSTLPMGRNKNTSSTQIVSPEQFVVTVDGHAADAQVSADGTVTVQGQSDELISQIQSQAHVDPDDVSGISVTATTNSQDGNLDEMMEYGTFLSYIDFNYEGISLPKVCVQKKKWTAQDVLSKLELVYG